MNQGQPSKTAEWVARQRAVHQVRDQSRLVLQDPLAVRILSEDQRSKLLLSEDIHQEFYDQDMRAYMVARSRYAEDTLERAVAAGVRQYVLLGAGLDTFAYRNPFVDLRVFEVDHPATQAWKRERLASASIPIPEHLTFAPVDFESQTIEEGLRAVDFQWDQPALFCWLGVTYYLTLNAFQNTLAFLAARHPGSGLVLDYILDWEQLNEREQRTLERTSERVASLGEPFKTFFTPEQMQAQLTRAGFTGLEDIGSQGINARYFTHRTDGLALNNWVGRLVSAWRPVG
ncbi:class I SAM-dependent methyltransferase [Melittangium boletus]|uniref:class I SAM-dependent methyltransferase n=1 Tax=Melittangium boletus TaxID=83453 RepID=UPI003DA4D290